MKQTAGAVLAALAAICFAVEDGFAQKQIGGHGGMVQALAFSQDGKTFASGGFSGIIRIWDVSTGELKRIIDAHFERAHWIKFWPDDQGLVSYSSSDGMRIWDLETGELNPIAPQLDAVHAIGLSPDKRMIATADWLDPIQLWDIETGKMVVEIDTSEIEVRRLTFSHDGRLLACACADGIRIWDAGSGQLLKLIQDTDLPGDLTPDVKSKRVVFLPDNRSVARSYYYYEKQFHKNVGTVVLWDVETGEAERFFGGDMTEIVFSPDGRMAAGTSLDKKIRVWDLRAGKVVFTTEEPSHDPVFSDNGRRLAYVSHDGVRIWNAETRELIATLGDRYRSQKGFSPDGKLFASGSARIKLWDVESATLIEELAGDRSWIRLVSFSPDGRSVVSSSFELLYDSSRVRVWSVSTGEQIASAGVLFERASFSPGGETIVAVNHHGGVLLLDPDTGGVIKEMPGARVHSAVFSPDGRTIAGHISAPQNTWVYFWDVSMGKASDLVIKQSGWVYALAYSPDGRTLAGAGSNGQIYFWDASSGKLMRTAKRGWGAVDAVAFSPGGQRLASGGSDSVVRVWDTANGAVRAEMKGHAGVVHTVAYSPDGRTIASAGDDGLIRLWDAKTFQLEQTLTGHVGWVNSVDFSPDGRALVSGGKDGRVLLWSVEDLPILWSNIKRPNSPLIVKNALLPNYPNPFNPETWIPFDLAQESSVTIAIYNSAGQTVRRMELGELPAGSYRVKGKAAYWDGRDALGAPAASGVYFVRIEAGSFSETRRMVLLK